MNTPRRPPSGTARSRARAARPVPTTSFLERNRGRLLGALAVGAIVVMAGLAFLNATSPAYACSTEWTPAPTGAPAPDATPKLGYVQQDLGRNHVSIGSFVRYALCPPATGNHYNAQGSGPIRPGVFGPDDQAEPQGWIHNLEHGGLVLLYRCKDGDTACDSASQSALRSYYNAFPNSPICNLPPGNVGPIIARFDQMAWPYAALVWGLVLPLQSLDTDQINAFFAQQGERTNPEPLCARPTPTPVPTATPGPSASTGPSASPTAAPTEAPTAAPTEAPTPAAS